MSIEPVGFDQSVISFRDQIGVDYAALDLVDDTGGQVSVRNGFSYYSGFPAETRPSRVPTGERRRFVILNTQPGVSQYEVLYISANYSASQAAAVRSIIDSVELSIAGEPTEFVITTQISPPGAGTINGGGVYSPDEEVTLSVTGNPGYRFVQWQGNVSNPNSAETTITATDDAMVKAVFVRQWQLVLDAQVGGSASGGGGYDKGTIVPFTATPDDGYRFDGWTGTGIEDALGTETTVTLNESHMATVTFVKV